MNVERPLITLTSDFGVQTQGVGAMEAVAYSICPNANVIHLMHGLPEFDTISGARTMETVRYIPVGAHVCVCDPGVGTKRKAVAIQVERGDYLVGPDNGVLIPAARVLGGIQAVCELSNPEYMRQPVSPIFHGRDIFTPAAAYLANGVELANFGALLEPSSLKPAAYEEARVEHGIIRATVIQLNRFGSFHLNVLHEQWDALNITLSKKVVIELPGAKKIELVVGETFGDVSPGENLILKDDYGRIEVAKNLGSFVKENPLSIGDEVLIEYAL